MAKEPPFRRRKLSVDDYHRMGQVGILDEHSRVELVEGELIELAPIGPRHASAVNRLAALLARSVDDAVALLSIQNPASLPPHSEPQPDLMLLRPRSDGYQASLPAAGEILLLIEVADSSLSYDTGAKLGLYARQGIAEVWIVDLLHHRLDVHRTPVGGRYAIHLRPDAAGSITPALVPQVSFAVAQLIG